MTGYQSKRAAALDEDGIYLVHQTDHSENNLNMVAQPAQEPVAWGVDWGKAGDIPCVSIIKSVPNGSIEVMAVEYAPHSYTAPAQRPWVGLTDDEKTTAIWTDGGFGAGALWAEAKLKEKNNGN